MRRRILTYRGGRKFPRILVDRVPDLRILKQDNSKYEPREGDRILCWGGTDHMLWEHIPGVRWLNKPSSVVLANARPFDPCPDYATVYRLHIFRGLVIDTAKKVGWKYEPAELPEGGKTDFYVMAAQCLDEQALQFAAVDIACYGSSGMVVGIDPAPGLEGETINIYGRHIAQFFGTTYQEAKPRPRPATPKMPKW